MRYPHLPDWAIYAAVVGAILLISLGRREKIETDRLPQHLEELGPLLGEITPFDPSVTVDAPDDFTPSAGTAFSIAGEGRWVTARHVVEGCRQPALVIGGGRALAADVRLADQADVALLLTEGGPPALPLSLDDPLRKGQRAYHPGFPQGRPGEVASRLIGRETLKIRGRGERHEPVLVWAESGRTRGLDGTLAGLSGAPVLDDRGRALGVTIAEAPRRGLVYTTAPDTFVPLVRGEQRADEEALVEAVTTENYGKVANQMRRDLRVAQVVCLTV